MSDLPVLVMRLHPDVGLPTYAYPGDAGADLVTTEAAELAPGERTVLPTGIAIALPEGYAAFVHPRSGLAARCGVALVNAPGTIDAGYRGEIKVIVVNLDPREPVRLRGRGPHRPAGDPAGRTRHVPRSQRVARLRPRRRRPRLDRRFQQRGAGPGTPGPRPDKRRFVMAFGRGKKDSKNGPAAAVDIDSAALDNESDRTPSGDPAGRTLVPARPPRYRLAIADRWTTRRPAATRRCRGSILVACGCPCCRVPRFGSR